ncbi:uncharacterized protein LOC132045797 [Lycium ferocissimum]|uniref:uncharacterized protein LOC132045797 n=1 Tax=Lycium ferocissimum TaxID=112874 RepID=UPI002814EF93|nr:uncharacterized protein LOC132045797 [Lycium ferocissimum]
MAQCGGERGWIWTVSGGVKFIFALLALVDDGRLGSCSRTGVRVGGGRWVKGVSSLRVGSWNIGTLTGKSIELVKILKKRRINIACVQETKWVGSRAKDVDEYKLWFSGRLNDRKGVGILVDSGLSVQVVRVKRVNDRMMTIKLVVGGFILHIISASVPQAGLGEEGKRRFWEDLDEMVGGIPPTEKLFIGGDFNGHIGSISGGYDDVHGDCSFGDRNGGGVPLLDFAKALG